MRARVKLVAPWWSFLTGDELRTTLEKTSDDGNGGVGKGNTRYAVYVDEDRVGFVYSLKGEKATSWFVDSDDSHAYNDRFTAVRQLLRLKQHAAA